MDKNTVIGIVLIGVIFFHFYNLEHSQQKTIG